MISKKEPLYGTFTADYPEPLIAGEMVTLRFTYTVGSRGMSEGGRLRIALPNPGWGEPLVPQHYFWDCYQKGAERRYTDYDRVNTTARIDSKARKAVPFLSKWTGFRKPFGLVKRWKRDYDRWWIEVLLEDDGLDPGDRVVLIYGDPERKPLSAYIQRFPDDRLWFLAFVDPSGNNEFSEAEGSPWKISVEAGEASQIKALMPSIVQGEEGEPELRVSYQDKVKVRPRKPVTVDRLVLDWPNGERRELRINKTAYSLKVGILEMETGPASSAYGENPVVDDPPGSFLGDTAEPGGPADQAAAGPERALRIKVTDPGRGFSALSNPYLCRGKGPLLFWGDLHAQSMYHGWSEEDQVGISCGTPEAIYDYAKNISGLDFCAVTDTGSLCMEIWNRVNKAALDANRDGEFVVFPGSELGDDIDGHRNTIFAGDRPEPRRKPDPDPDKPSHLPAHKAQDVFHGRDDVLLTYHHTKVWNNWSKWDPTVESLLEIYSCWGSGEKPGTDLWDVLAEHSGGAQEAWAKGYRLGVCAASDTHTGTPGRDIRNAERDEMLIYPCGLTGVWAEELTREAIFRSLKNRYCYGTTGKRIILEFFLNDRPMGSEIEVESPSKQRRITVKTYACDVIERVDIVKNNESVHSFFPDSEDFEAEWKDSTDAGSGDFYYLRLSQRDNHRAWSSPIWVDLV